jgi:hypothetical protein
MPITPHPGGYPGYPGRRAFCFTLFALAFLASAISPASASSPDPSDGADSSGCSGDAITSFLASLSLSASPAVLPPGRVGDTLAAWLSPQRSLPRRI